MKTFFGGFAAALLIFGSMLRAIGATEIAATVNGHIITMAELNRQVEHLSPNLPANPASDTRARTLDALIDRELLIQAFRRDAGEIAQSFIDARVRQIIHEEYGGDHVAFEQTLRARGISLQQYREEIEDNAIITQMRGRKILSPEQFSAWRQAANIKVYVR